MRRFRSRKPADAANTWKTIVETVLFPTVLAYLLAEWVVRADPTQTESPCLSNPCVYGICLDDVNSTFHCYCIDGYTGFLCQTNWDECWSNPCMNGGLCIDGIAHYNCTCPQGYQGDFCEQNIDECISNPCRNNGTCIDGSNGYTCVCPSGYVGVLCETDVSVCNDTRETRCLNGGLCTEGPGLSFNCVCPLGWTGQLCEESVDECSSSPCQNGAVCLDLHANYMCACPFGFTGKNCEAELEMCGDSSPCQNGALCLVEDWLRICYCVPDFHGDRCQYRYNECLLGPGCKNGGTCIDGVDGYNCTCPPGWSGSYCECLIKSDDHMECDPFFPSQVTALTLLPESHQTVPKFWTENQVPKTTPYKIPSSTPLIPQYPTECFPVWPHYTTQTPKTSTQVVVTKKLPADEQKTSSLPPQEITPSTRLTTSTIPTKSTTMSTTTFSTIISIAAPTTITLASTTMTSTTETSTTSTTTTPITTTTSTTLPPTTTTTPITTTTSTTLPPTTTTTPITTTTSTTLPSTTTTTTTITTTTSAPLLPTTTTTTTSAPTTTTASTTSSTTQTTMPSTTQVPPTTTTSTTTSSLPTTPEAIEKTAMTNSTKPMTTTTESISPVQTDSNSNISLTVNTETTMNETRTSPQPTTEDFIHTINLNPPTTPSSTAMPGNCKTVPCFNEGSCVNTTSGVRCICKSNWEGPFCEQKVDLKVVGFSKNSYVRHRLTNTQNIKIGVTARTIAPVGIILYSHLGNRIFMTLYLENGYLKFKFSCGLQVMILSEVQYLLNNGYDFIISVSLDFLPLTTVPDHCAATVRVNNTIAMSGEQVSGGPHADSGFAWVYVGGVPIQYSDPQEIPIPEGFIGCMQNLTIDHQTKGIFKDSFDSVEVSSCKSLACLSNPCRGGSSCIEHNNTWTCLCPSGFLGRRCEKSVCENNPCQFGGTCVPFPGSGFICLCPFGKQGLFCENSIETGYPLFASSINGLSSFAAYKIPSEIYQDLQLTFKFVPHDMEQISLMLFMGQDGYHGATSDHLAVSFIKGYIVLTWNLGSGPRRIFTPYPVPNLGRLFHTVRIGRHGQRAWLLVDDQRNVTGKSPGKLTQLNTRSIVYLGGHDSQNFSFLPHDLPLHTGFSGCLFDVELRTSQMLIKVDKSPPAFTRGVGHCGQNLCNERSCENGGGCINHGATFACLCAEGWFGPTCSTRYNPCDSTRHNCTEGSTCVPLKEGYSCDCPVGKTGVFCEKEEDLSDVKFKGIRSYIALSVIGLNHQQSCIDLEIRPATNHGLILYSGRPETNSFWSLTLQDGLVELRVSPGVRRKQGEVLIVKSRRMLALDKWHRIRAGRYGRRLFLWVEGTVNTGVLLPGENLPPGGTTVYLGGMPDLSKIPIGVSGNVLKPFEGCIRKFGSQWKTIPLTKSTILHGRNVEDCDGTVCGADVCNNGGTCHINANNIPICACLKQYKGERCEYRLSCQQMNCQNGGRCAEGKTRNPQCYCPNGWSGSFCESPLSVKSPQFGGESYLMIDKSENANTKKRNVVSPKIDVDFIRLNFTTPEPNGFLLWTSSENHAEFVGIGVENERMKFVWNWEGHNATVVTSDHHVADGIWHQIAIGFDTPNVTIWLDERLVYSANDTYPGYPPSTDGKFYLGGFPAGSKVPDRTNGFFQTGFNGCLQEVDWGLEFPISNFSKFQGENIQTCDPF